MIYNIAIFDDISNSVGVALRSFFGHLVALIYNLIEYLYKLFDYISRAEILDNEFIQSIYSKVGLILGLFMLFKLVFSLVNSLISPDKLDDKKNGAVAIIKRSILSIVLLGITPTLFDEAFEIQRLLVGNSTGDNVLYKLISNSPTTAETEIGHTLATDLYLSFYTDYETPHLNNGTIDTIYDTDDEYYDRFINDNFENLEFNLREGNISFGDTVDYLAIKNSENKYVIEFNWLVLLIVGGVVAWMMAMYCIQAATRVVQLAYLQLIAPVPILSYISDPEGSFKRWIKQCTSTYLDLFFRLAIIYFVMTMVKDVLDQFGKAGGIIFESTGIPTNENFTLALVKVLIILGLLLFAKRAPELLKELFPNLGKGPFSYSLKPSKVFNDTSAAGAIGGVVGAAGGLASNTIHGFMNTKKAFREKGFVEGMKSLGKTGFSMVGGTLGGARAGLKTKDVTKLSNAVRVSNENREKRELKAKAGYTWYRPDKVVADKILGFAGETTGAEAQIKTAEFRKDALQQSKVMQWQNFADANEIAITAGDIDLSLLRSMQKFEEKGVPVWRGIDMNGNERAFKYDTATNKFVSADGGTALTRGGTNDVVASKIVMDSANTDDQIKRQGKIIKGLQTADSDAKK